MIKSQSTPKICLYVSQSQSCGDTFKILDIFSYVLDGISPFTCYDSRNVGKRTFKKHLLVYP